MPRMKSPGYVPQIRFKVEEMGMTVGDLARLLAEELQNAALFQQDADAYDRQAANERVKMQQYNGILMQLREREKNPPARVRRMDPLAEYDKDAVEAEREVIKSRHIEFTNTAAEFRVKADKSRRKASTYQTRIRDLNQAGKHREAKEIIGPTAQEPGDGQAV